jgi:hypothetical protein
LENFFRREAPTDFFYEELPVLLAMRQVANVDLIRVCLQESGSQSRPIERMVLRI